MNRNIRYLAFSILATIGAQAAFAADAPANIKPAAASTKGVQGTASNATVKVAPVTGKTSVPTSAIGGNVGGNQYPGTTPPPPKPPKKEALDAAALKAQGATAK